MCFSHTIASLFAGPLGLATVWNKVLYEMDTDLTHKAPLVLFFLFCRRDCVSVASVLFVVGGCCGKGGTVFIPSSSFL